MSTPAITAPDLQVVQGEIAQSHVLPRFGYESVLDPTWVERLLLEDQIAWLLDRWDSETGTLTFGDHDNVHKEHVHGTVSLAGLPPIVALEILTGIAHDRSRGNSQRTTSIRSVAKAARVQQVSSITHLTRDQLANAGQGRWVVWVSLLEVAAADVEMEWLRDEVRIQVIRPTEVTKRTIRLGGVTQGWLRDLLVDFLRIRAPQVVPATLQQYAEAFTALSGFLATRADRGEQPRQLTGKTMLRFTEHLAASDMTVRSQYSLLRYLSAVLNEARALDLTMRHQLPNSFTVRREYLPAVPTADRVERAIPLAAFCLLMGQDKHLGTSVFDLMVSMRPNAFDGQVQVRLETFMGNFGRRIREACEITCDRFRFDDLGAAALLYDDFKTGRERVWLPIDATEVEPLREHIADLRVRFPNTPIEELRLFPKSRLEGTLPVASVNASQRHTWWVRTLEQAIVLAKLQRATQASLADLCAMQVLDLGGDGLTVAGSVHILTPETRNMLIDHRHQLLRWVQDTKYFPGEDALPLFPRWMVGDRTGRAKRGHVIYPPVTPELFAPLGDNWVERAASYLSPGIPGGNLGKEPISPDALNIEQMRHTYLQHLYNTTRDIHLVSELAGHSDVGITFNAYVTAHDQLREATDKLSQFRQDLFGHARSGTLSVVSSAAVGIPVNCERPQVLQFGVEGCHKDRQCFRCEHYSADPSNIRDIDREVTTCLKALATAKAEPDDDLREANVLVLNARIKGWRAMRANLQALLDALPPTEREQVELACQIVQEFRDQVRGGGPTAGTVLSQLRDTQ